MRAQEKVEGERQLCQAQRTVQCTGRGSELVGESPRILEEYKRYSGSVLLFNLWKQQNKDKKLAPFTIMKIRFAWMPWQQHYTSCNQTFHYAAVAQIGNIQLLLSSLF